NAIRDRTHWNTTNIKPQNPVGLGLCAGDNLEKAVAVARKRAGITHSPGAAVAPDGINPVTMVSGAVSDTEPMPEPAVPQAAEASLPSELVEPAPESEPAAEPQPESEPATQLQPAPEAAVPPAAEASLPTEPVEPALESEPAAEPQPESEALTEEPNT
ncbi:MAG: cell cycle transcriptional regulator TrcR, partial [Rhodospirillales bacterium]